MKLSEETEFKQLQTQMILLGISGMGKSSAVIPLAIPEIVKGWPGLEIRALDFDGKLKEVALTQLRTRLNRTRANRVGLTPISKEQYEAALENIDIEVCREKTKIIQKDTGKELGVESASAWKKAVRALERWLSSMDETKLLFVDSWTHMATQAVPTFTQAANNKLNVRLTWEDYLPAQQILGDALRTFADLGCHCIISAHQAPLDIYKKTGEVEIKNGRRKEIEEIVDSMIIPLSLGKAGRVQVPAQLNHMLVVTDNSNGVRQIYTKPSRGVATKSPFFALAKATYGLDTGLVEYWQLGATSAA